MADAPPPVPTYQPTLYGADGHPLDLSGDDAAKAIAAGKAGFLKGQQVHVVQRDGSVGTIKAEDAPKALQQGMRLATDAEVHHAKVEARQSGIGAQVLGNLGEFAGNATFGLSDVVGSALGGEGFRQERNEFREAHPNQAMVSGALGIVVPALVGDEAGLLGAAGDAADVARASDEAASVAREGDAIEGGFRDSDGVWRAKGGAIPLGSDATNATEATQTLSGAPYRAPEPPPVAPQPRPVVAPPPAPSPLSVARTALGAPNRAISGIRNGIEDVVRGVLGADGEGSLVTGLAKKALAKGAGVAAEGALVGGAQQLDENVLSGDPEGNGEKLLVAMGHGALLGLGGAGALTALGELGSRVLGRASPALGGMAEEQAFRSLSARKAFANEADKIPGGVRGVGRRLLDEGLVGFGDRVQDVAPKIAEARQAAGDELGQILENADKAGFEGPSVYEIERQIRREVIPKLEKLPLGGDEAIAKVERVIAKLKWRAEGASPFEPPGSLFDIGLAGSETTAPRAQRAIQIAGEDVGRAQNIEAGLADTGERGVRMGAEGPELGPAETEPPIAVNGPAMFMRKGESVTLNPDMLEGADVAEGGVGVGRQYEVGLKPGALTEEPGAVRKPIKIGENVATTEKRAAEARELYDKNLRLTFKQMQDFRANLDDVIKWNTNPLAPINETTDALKKIRGIMEGQLEEAGEQAANKLGGSFRDEYRAAKLRYRQLSLADKAAQDAVTRTEANRVISPTDYIGGDIAAHAFGHMGRAAAGGLAGAAAGEYEGGTEGMLGGLATGAIGALAHHSLRTRGNAAAAVMLDKLSALRGIERASRHVDNQIERGVAGFFKEEGRIPVKLREPIEGERGDHPAVTAIKKVARAVANDNAHADDIRQAAAPIEPHAPQTANSFQRAALRATMFLSDRIPKTATRPSITPQFDKPALSDAQKADYHRLVTAVHDPASVLDDMAKGRVTRAQVDALRMVYPSLYAEVVERVHERLADLKHPLSYAQKVQLSTLLGVPADETLSPAFVQAMQASYGAPGGGGAPAGGKGAPKRMQRPLKGDLSHDVELAMGQGPHER